MPQTKLPDIAPLTRALGLRPRVTEHLMTAIFRRSIVAGDRLIVAKLAHQLGVSASPVREALVELAGVGLVELLPNRGAVCLAFGPRQLRELFDLRRVLEAEAARLACGHIPEATLQELRRRSQDLIAAACSAPPWSQEALDVDIALHDLIVDHCDHQRLCREIQRYAEMMRCVRRVAGNRQDIQVRAIEDHLALLDALLAGQPEQAAQRMAEHMDRSAARLEQLIFQTDAPSPP